MTRITPDRFRRIADAVTEEGLSYAGEPIEIIPENAPMLAQAIEILTSGTAGAEFVASEAETPERTFARAERSLRSALADLERLATMRLDIGDQEKLSSTLAAARDTLERISASVKV